MTTYQSIGGFYNLLLSGYDIVIFEGFEMVGKSTLLEKYKEMLSNSNIDFIYHRPDYEGVLKGLVDYDKYYLVGLSSFDALLKCKDRCTQIILDRSQPSNIAYSIGKCQTGVPLDKLRLAYEKLTHNLNVLVVHCNHLGSEDNFKSAQEKYKSAMSTRAGKLSKYDTYSSFPNYLKDYIKFEEIYKLVYSQYTPINWTVVFVDPYYYKEDIEQ